MRDWMASLWPASFNGAPFWVEKDSASTGRRLSVEELPDVDDPFVEDLGRSRRDVTISGYLIGDVSDVESTALEAACEIPGPGVLVLPALGPIQAYCETFSRSRERDKLGRYAFDAKFVRVGLDLAPPGLDYLAQLAFDANDSLAAALPAFLAAGIAL